jgi:nucleoside-diphosphate-sugar epimerase
MKRIFITGGTGFVGKNVINFLGNNYNYTFHVRNNNININHDIVLHFAGLAHDTKYTTNPEEFYISNLDFTKSVFDNFLISTSKVFIFLSSVKAVADHFEGELSEDVIPNPISHYGNSKLKAENYIFSKLIPQGKRVYVLRPCMIHGPGNKGNLNLIYNFISNGFPWPLGAFDNSRSLLSIDNLSFVIKELIDREDIPSGIYNIADDMPLSTKEIIKLIALTKERKAIILNLNKNLIKRFALLGDSLKLSINSDRLHKLTESYVVSNTKIKVALGKNLPISSKDGLMITFKSFSNIG